jgi:hypothetical protein
MKCWYFKAVGLVACASALLASIGCQGIINDEAEATFLQVLGRTSITVYPAFVRQGQDNTYEPGAAEEIGAFFADEGLATVTISAEEVPITGGWGMNQARMLRESAEDFTKYVVEHDIATDYALLPEYLTFREGRVGGIHCYILDAEGTVAYATLLNSHHRPFQEANPQTVADCTAVLTGILLDDLKPAAPAE